jgi:hypothetical protein
MDTSFREETTQPQMNADPDVAKSRARVSAFPARQSARKSRDRSTAFAARAPIICVNLRSSAVSLFSSRKFVSIRVLHSCSPLVSIRGLVRGY